MNSLTLLALAFAGANAAGLNKRQYLSEGEAYLSDVCRPVSETGDQDWSAPCNAVISIQYTCMFGTAGGELLRTANPGTDYEEPTEQPIEAQRVCICESQFRDQMAGCMDCMKAHGGVEGRDWFSSSLIDPAVEKYCDASTPASEGFADYLFNQVEGSDSTTDDSTTESTTFSDPIGNKTDVPLYFTPSVTGTPAYIPAVPTPESSGGNVTYTSSMTSGGEIVPTAIGNEREQSSGSSQTSGSSQISGSAQSSGAAQSGSATASSDAGAMQTAMAHPGTFGALGLAALIAAL